jgi:hypothetical protein
MTLLEALALPTFSLSGHAVSSLVHLKRKLLFVQVRNTVSYLKPFIGKGGKFSGGFDISSFGNLHSGESMLYSSIVLCCLTSVLSIPQISSYFSNS